MSDDAYLVGYIAGAAAERERIAQRLEREAADEQEDLYDRAAAIARGDA